MDKSQFMDYISTELGKRVSEGRLVLANNIDGRLLEIMEPPRPGERIFQKGFKYAGGHLGFGWAESQYVRRPQDPENHHVSLFWNMDKIFHVPNSVPKDVAELEAMGFKADPINGKILIGFPGGYGPLMRTSPDFDQIAYSNWPVVPQGVSVEQAVRASLDFLCDTKHDGWTGE